MDCITQYKLGSAAVIKKNSSNLSYLGEQRSISHSCYTVSVLWLGTLLHVSSFWDTGWQQISSWVHPGCHCWRKGKSGGSCTGRSCQGLEIMYLYHRLNSTHYFLSTQPHGDQVVHSSFAQKRHEQPVSHEEHQWLPMTTTIKCVMWWTTSQVILSVLWLFFRQLLNKGGKKWKC